MLQQSKNQIVNKTIKRLLSSAVLMSLPFTMAAAKDNQELIDLARQEAQQGTFEIMVSSPKGERAQRKLMEEFQKRFDLDLDWDWSPLTSTVSAPRVHQQATSGLAVPSAIGGYGYNTYEHWFASNDLDTEVDWVGEFGEMFPGIERAAVEGVLPEYRDRMLRQWDVQYVMAYNTNLLTPEEVPTSLWDLTKPEWSGRFAMANNTPPPLDILAVEFGVDKAVDLAAQLLANDPRFKAGPPAVVGAIANGEVAVGVSGYTALVESMKAQGAPVDWVPLEVMPIGPLFVFMLDGAPQPNLGKLFLAWLVTEGAALQEEVEYLSLFSNPEAVTTQKIKEMRPDVQAIEVLDIEDLKKTEAAAKQIMSAVAGVAGK